MMKYLSLIPLLALCACGNVELVKPDNKPHDIAWPTGECRGIIKAVVVEASEWQHPGTQFIAQCEDGRIVYNISNFTVK